MIGPLTPQCHIVLAFVTYVMLFSAVINTSTIWMNKISRLNSISTLLSRCLRLAPAITDDNPRLATAGWLDLTRTGFPPARLITLCWAHNYYLSANHLYFSIKFNLLTLILVFVCKPCFYYPKQKWCISSISSRSSCI